jgi:hypothetical protein
VIDFQPQHHAGELNKEIPWIKVALVEALGTKMKMADLPHANLVPRSLFRLLHKSLETAKTIHKILVDYLII